MATDVLETGLRSFAPPYPPSWLDRFGAGLERLPWGADAWYVGLAVVTAVGAGAIATIPGLAPTGQTVWTQVYYALFLVAMLWLIHSLDGAASGALESFRRALTIDERGADELRYRLTVIPARGALVLTAVGYGATILQYVAAPEASRIGGLSASGLAIRTLTEGLGATLFLILAYHTLRQLRAVDRIHRLATRVDLFQPAPIYAFSRLTSRTAIGLTVLTSSTFVGDPDTLTKSSVFVLIPWVAGTVAIAAVAFVVPLRGMHARVVAEKQRLRDAVGQRLTATIGELHAAVDAGDLPRADGLNKMLASLIAERDLIDHLPTWPWRPGTAGALVSALLLPLGLWLITRLLGTIV